MDDDATPVLAPVAGRVLPMAAAPDVAFAAGMLGAGVAIDPVRVPGPACSPIAGVLTALQPHAFVVTAPTGTSVLVHLGIDTVTLAGAGFQRLAVQGDSVPAGAPVLQWDPAAVESRGRSPLVLVSLPGSRPDALQAPAPGREVSAGEALFRLP